MKNGSELALVITFVILVIYISTVGAIIVPSILKEHRNDVPKAGAASTLQQIPQE